MDKDIRSLLEEAQEALDYLAINAADDDLATADAAADLAMRIREALAKTKES